MRVWWLPYQELDGRRIVAQHQELHALAEMFKGRIATYMDKDSLKPHHLLKWDYLEGHIGALLFMHLHDVVLRDEFNRRNYASYIGEHSTPLSWQLVREHKETKILKEYDLHQHILGPYHETNYREIYRGIEWPDILKQMGMSEKYFLTDVWDLQERWTREIERDKDKLNSMVNMERRILLEKSLAKYGDLRGTIRPR